MSIGRGGRVHSCRSPADSKKKKKWWKGATIVVYFIFFVLFVFVPACFDFSQQLGWFSFTVKLLYAFLVLFFSGKLCCIEAAGRLVEESFNGKQTSTTTTKKNSLLCDEGGFNYAPQGRCSVNQRQLWFLSERLIKVTLANNVCTSVSPVTNTNHHTVECFCISSYQGYLRHVLSEAVKTSRPILSGFSSCIYSCLKLKFACLRPAHVQKTIFL